MPLYEFLAHLSTFVYSTLDVFDLLQISTNESTSDIDQSNLFNEPHKLFEPDSETQVEENMPSTQDLEDICSGRFTAASSSNKINEICIQDKTLSKRQSSVTSPKSQMLTYSDEIKTTDDQDDQFISQLLDEEELEKFKKKFDSPVISNSETEPYKQMPQDEESDDEEVEEINMTRKKTRQKRLVFSGQSVCIYLSNESFRIHYLSTLG